MNYVLEKLDDVSVDYLMRSTSESKKLFRVFTDAKRRGWLPPGWARDLVADSFLISLPSLVREESGERCYCFYWEGLPYEVRFPSLFGSDAQLIAPASQVSVISEKLNEALRAAFAVHKEGITVKDGQLMAIGEAVVPLLRIEP
jgi:hypothetical protein